jgi:NAD-dependent dihydropyrimidine dehydrogenase PreA subunit
MAMGMRRVRIAIWIAAFLMVIVGAVPVPAQEGQMDPAQVMKAPFARVAEQKGVDAVELASKLGLPPDADLNTPTGELLKANGLSLPELQHAMRELMAESDPLAAEAQEKDWLKIRLKFILWVALFVAAMYLLAAIKITPVLRASMLAGAAIIFGVWLGVEPNAPGTVKDGLHLYGEAGVIFRPRLIAFLGFMLMSIIGNKVFCGWGCHFGALQDFFWHLKTKKYKPPFWLSNLVRVVFFAALAGAALFVPLDIMEPIDPFRIFRPATALAAGGAIALGVSVLLLVIGIWVYRPWCTFLCPFGLVSWLGERVSIFRPRVNHDTCIDCKACERACPTHSMEGIRAGRRWAQDCFACGACVRVCPVTAVKWGVRPPGSAPEEDGEDDVAEAS